MSPTGTFSRKVLRTFREADGTGSWSVSSPAKHCAAGAPARFFSPEMRSISGDTKPSLDGFSDFAALEAAGAHVGALRLAVQEHADALEIRVEAALRRHHRVAPVVTKARLLAADCADLRHRPGSVAEPDGYPAAAVRSCEKRSAISRAARTASAPLATRASACSRVSHVSTPNETGMPVSNPASWRPLAASEAT